MIKRFLAAIFFVSIAQFAMGQDCSVTLDEAKNEFAAGHLEAISSILNDCLKNGFTKEQKIEAYRLLTISYLYLDDPFGAEASFLKLLEVEPEYRIAAVDPIELEYLSRKYITTPIISYSFKAGANFSFIKVLNRNNLGAETDNNWSYSPRAGFNVMGALDLHFNKVLSLNVETQLSSRSYVKRDSIYASSPNYLQELRTNLHVNVPISIKYTYPGIKYYPYAYAGYSPAYTISSNSNNTYKPYREVEIAGSGLSSRKLNPDFSHSMFFGAGVKRRFGYKYLLVDVRYRVGMTDMLNADTQYDFSNDATKDKIFKYLLADDDYRWNGLEIAVGFVWPIYKPRAKNSVTIQTVMQNWFSKNKKNND